MLGIEVKRFIGAGIKTLMPRVARQTETARQKKSSGTKDGISRGTKPAVFIHAGFDLQM
jgi:hypothetical protein